MSVVCSIVVPVYEDPGFLRDTLESVRAQTIADWEAIVVDDGSSTDSAEHVVADLADPRIRFIRHERNRGVAAARNTGIRDAKASLILPLDSDDMLDPRYLEVMLPHLAPGSPADCAFPDFEFFGRHGGGVSWPSGDPVTLLHGQWIPGPGTVMRRSLWEAVGGYCEAPELRIGNEDLDFWVAALGVGLRYAHVREPLYRYRTREGSMMTGLDRKLHVTHEFIYARHRGIFDAQRAGGAFLARGYMASAEASRVSGHRVAAIRLALAGWRHDPLRPRALAIIGRALLPTRLHRAVRAARRALRGGSA